MRTTRTSRSLRSRGAAKVAPLALVTALTGASFAAGAVPAHAEGSTEAPKALEAQHDTGSGQQNVYDAAHPGLPDVPNPGQYLFQNGCSTCHGVDGKGTKDAPSLIGVGAAAADFYLSSGRMPLGAPVAQAPRKKVKYSKEQIAAITAYVASLGPGPEIPAVDPKQGNLVEGQEVYANNCAACHNSQASGGALGRDYYAPRLFKPTATQIAEAVRVGPGAMPVFSSDQLSDEQVNSLVKYIEHIRDNNTHGGLHIGRVGPVTEGFVAWIVGLGLLLALTRWIGTRV